MSLHDVHTISWSIGWSWRRWGLSYTKFPSLHDGWERYYLEIGPFVGSWSIAGEDWG